MLHTSHSKNYESECADNASHIYVGNMTGWLRLGKKVRFKLRLKETREEEDLISTGIVFQTEGAEWLKASILLTKTCQ